ncbi:MAG: flagellar hook capping FlgD N-terminal domain-containing protein [Xanthomonadaceae bacterium]|nr:flagellar hook capping FlgD N-terminal domain-containing protein [Xanthomonadaceae bacterium]
MSITTQSIISELGLSVQPPERKKELGQDDFLRLMTEQLKNQDPLKPLASNEFLGQLAQFSTVQGIEALNNSFGALVAGVESDQALQAAALVGHSALVASDRFALGEEGGVSGEVQSPFAGRLTMEISDPPGNVIHRYDIEAGAAGPVPFAWTGLNADGEPYPPGEYRIAARVSAGAATEALQTFVAARIDSVSLTSQGLVLNLAGVGSAPLASIRRIG